MRAVSAKMTRAPDLSIRQCLRSLLMVNLTTAGMPSKRQKGRFGSLTVQIELAM